MLRRLALLVAPLVIFVTGAASADGANPKRPRDATAPTVSIAAPAAGASLSSSVTVAGSAADNVQVAKVEVRVDGGAYVTASGTTSWSVPLDTTKYANGTHSISARATDTSGNVSALAAVSVSFTNTVPDTAPPSVAITAPLGGATLRGSATVSGSAADNVQVARVEVKVDGGAYATASGTTSWSLPVDTAAYADGSHTITARSTDSSGNVSSLAIVAVNFSNAAADTTPPTVSIAAPTAGSTVGGSLTVAGSAADDVALAKVEVSVDGGTFAPASGTSSWTFTLNSASYADGSHTITARATDTAGNAATSSVTIAVKNSTTLPPGVVDQLITPEGVTIQIYSDVTTGWTAAQIYNLLKPNAYQLSLVGPHLTIKVQTTYASSTSTSAVEINGAYSSYKATMYLQATASSLFATRPDDVVAHEYGHAWTMYHFYLTEHGDWTSYLSARGILGDPRVDSTYNWSKSEMIADDYRLLFGTTTAQSEMAYINPDVPDPRAVAGLKDFFVNVWGA